MPAHPELAMLRGQGTQRGRGVRTTDRFWELPPAPGLRAAAGPWRMCSSMLRTRKHSQVKTFLMLKGSMSLLSLDHNILPGITAIHR